MAKKLDLHPDMEFQEKDWFAERIVWILMALFVLAGLIGVFGRGGLSSANAQSGNNKMKVKYERFLRYHTEDQIEIKINRAAASTFLSLLFSKDFDKKVQLQSTSLKPERTLLTPNGTLYIFTVAPALQQANITFNVKPEKMGSLQGTITDNEGNQVSISQFIYP